MPPARSSSPGTGDEPFAVERRRDDPPADAVEDEQRRPNAQDLAGQQLKGRRPHESTSTPSSARYPWPVAALGAAMGQHA